MSKMNPKVSSRAELSRADGQAAGTNFNNDIDSCSYAGAGLGWAGLVGAWEGICHILGLTSDQSIQDTEDTDTNTAHWETAHPPIHLLQTSVFNFVFYSALPLYEG